MRGILLPCAPESSINCASIRAFCGDRSAAGEFPLKMFVPSPAAGQARLAIFLVFSLLGGASRAAGPSWEEPKASWRNGPVREVLTPEEDKAFRALKTDEERSKAIAEFWTRRDPTPGTPENEYHADFAKRVEDANSQFGEGSGPGWMTDRGRLLLVAGY